MFRIAVCDDEPQVCAQLEKMVLNYGDQAGILMEVDVFFSGEELYQAISVSKEAVPDLIFLDIELKLLSGIDVGHKIREELQDEGVQIVYISANQGYSMELFAVRPMNFLIKPLTEEKVFADISTAHILSGRRKRFFQFEIGKEHFRIPLSKIIYFESKGRKIHILCLQEYGGDHEFYGRLGKVEEELKEEGFFRIHRSYLINEHWVRNFEYGQVTLLNNEVIPISQPYRKTVREKLMNRRE